MKLTREFRTALRSHITANPGWAGWRAVHLANPDGTLRDASSMARADYLRAALHLKLDVVGIAASVGMPLTWGEFHAALLAVGQTTTIPPQNVLNTSAASNFAVNHSEDDEDEDDDTVSLVETPATAKGANMTADNATVPNPFRGRDPAAILTEVLAPADGMVGVKLMSQLADAVRPLVNIALAPPPAATVVEKEVVRTVTIRAPGGDTDGEGATLPKLCNPVSNGRGRDVFGIKGTISATWRSVLEQDVSIWDGTPAEGVPAVDPHHVWDLEALAYLTMASRFADNNHALRRSSRVLMYGPAGTGKTTGAMQFAAKTNRPFVRIAFDRTTETAELIGQRMPKAGGGTIFREGALVQAMQVPGCVVLLDEPSFLRPGAAAVLQTMLDTGVVYLKEDNNRCVEMAPGVIILAADNTALNGDETGRYADTLVQNIALQDRFGFIVPLDYMPEGQEANVLVARTGIPMAAARAMVGFASTTRKGAANGQLTAGCSLRRLMAWATAVNAGIPSAAAFKSTVFNATDAADREVIRGLEKNSAGHNVIDAAMSGTAPVVTPDMSTQAQAAASVFATPPSQNI